MQLISERGERTNELAADVQAGTRPIDDLWEAVRRFAVQQAQRWFRAFDGNGGVEEDDLSQVAFCSLVEALQGWNSEKCAFLTHYGYSLKNGFAAACGVRTERARRDPINFAVPLDEPLGEDNDSTLADVIPDPDMDIEGVCVALDCRAAVAAALAQLPENERTAMISEFWYGQRADAKTRTLALRHLRHPSISRTLKDWL